MSSGVNVKGSVVQTDLLHHRIHQGRLYSVNQSVQSLADAARLNMLIRTPATTPIIHGRMTFSVGGVCSVDVMRSPTISDDGTAIIPFNHNDIKATPSALLVFGNPTVTIPPDEELLQKDVILREDSETDGFIETIFRPGTDYVVSVENVAGSSTAVRMRFVFYEVFSLDEL